MTPEIEVAMVLAFWNLTHWATWPVVILAGVAFRWWWVPLPAGVAVAWLTEVLVVEKLRAALAPVGIVGPRDLGLGDLLPGIVVGAVLTFAVQRLVRVLRNHRRVVAGG